jgi:hypothetical protein
MGYSSVCGMDLGTKMRGGGRVPARGVVRGVDVLRGCARSIAVLLAGPLLAVELLARDLLDDLRAAAPGVRLVEPALNLLAAGELTAEVEHGERPALGPAVPDDDPGAVDLTATETEVIAAAGVLLDGGLCGADVRGTLPRPGIHRDPSGMANDMETSFRGRTACKKGPAEPRHGQEPSRAKGRLA